MVYRLIKIVYRYIICELNIRTLLRNHFINRLSSLDLTKIGDKKDVLFILGSGASINEISKQGWKNISEGVSVGLNYWIIHDFVPSLLMFEIPRSERANYFFNILHKKKSVYQGVPMLLKGLYLNRTHFNKIHKLYRKFPKELLSEIYLCQEFPIPGKNDVEYTKALNMLFKLDFFKKRENATTLAQYRGTVMCAIIFGIIAGFKNIVLCGVDLNNTNYFYEEDKIYYESKGLTVPPTGQEGVVHKTNIRLKNSLPISDAIVILSKFYSKHMNGKICVANKNSALYPTLDYYEI
jgi:hypothetical protein